MAFGIPACTLPDYLLINSRIITEVSSYQLTQIKQFKPKIATILNFSQNHLRYHKTLKEYFKAKLQITKNQDESDFLILPNLSWAHQIKTRARKLYFGIDFRLSNNQVTFKVNLFLVCSN